MKKKILEAEQKEGNGGQKVVNRQDSEQQTATDEVQTR
jgi:hypothetical protein